MRAEKVTLDDLLIKLGEFGRYQIVICNLSCLFCFIGPWQTFIEPFISGEPDHWCQIPEWEAENCSSHGINSSWTCSLAKKEVGIPWNYTEDGDKAYDQCGRYNVTDIMFHPDLDLEGGETVGCDAGWVYDNAQYQRNTINAEFDLVCGTMSYMTTLSQSLFFAGVLVGNLVGGHLSDRLGRHPCLFIYLALLVCTGVAAAGSVNVWMFMVVRFFSGVFTMATINNSFVYANEFVGPSKRSIPGSLIWVYYALGYMCLAVMAYYIRDWRHLQFTVAAIPVALFLLYWFLPESPRWLLSKGRKDKAERIIEKLARVNKTEMQAESAPVLSAPEEQEKEEGPNLLEIFKRPKLRSYTFNFMFNMAANAVLYIGLSLSFDTLGVNIYVAFFIFGAIEIPASLVIIFVVDRWGRRPSYVSMIFASGVSCLVTIFVPLGPWRAAVAVVGKFAITASFGIIYLHVCEVYPTPLRNSALGMINLCGNVANIFGPMILELSKIWGPFPLVIFGVFAILAGSWAFFLPETRGKKIPETLEESENIGWKAGPRRIKSTLPARDEKDAYTSFV